MKTHRIDTATMTTKDDTQKTEIGTETDVIEIGIEIETGRGTEIGPGNGKRKFRKL